MNEPEEREEDDSNAMMEELRSIRSFLDDESNPAQEDILDVDEVLEDILNKEQSANDAATEPVALPTNQDLPESGQIPLLQELFDPDRPDDVIQLEQLRTAGSSIISDAFITGEDSQDQTEAPIEDDSDADLSESDSAEDEPMDFNPDLQSSTADVELDVDVDVNVELDDDPDTDPDVIETAYSEYQKSPLPEEIVSESDTEFSALAPLRTEEFVDSLIEEHVDEILDLFRNILNDKLSLLLAQSQDSLPGLPVDDLDEPGDEASDLDDGSDSKF